MADNDVTVRYLLRDDASAGLERIEAQADKTGNALRRTGNNSSLLAFFDALDGKTGNLGRQFDSLDKKLGSASRTMQRDLIIGLRDITAGLTVAAGAATFFGLKAVNSFQHTQAAFSVLTGSMANGQQLYNQLMALNLKSPFDMQPLASSEQTLLGFGFNQRNSLPLLQNISNIASVQQDPNEALMRMALAVGQINQSGTVRAQDLNQLVQAGLPAYKLIPGGKAGILAGGGGQIPSSQFIAALSDPNNAVLRPYAGAAQAMNNTLSGQWSNLTTLVRQEAIKAFSPLGDALVKEMPNLTKVLQGEVAGMAPALSTFGADLIKGAEALLPVLDPIVKALLSGVHELATAGAPFLHELAAQDPAIAKAIGDFFSTLAKDSPELLGLFGGLMQLLPPFVHGLDELLTVVDPVLKLVDGLLALGPVRTIVGDLLVALLAYRTLAPAVKAVLGMRDALFGLAAAEEAAAVAGTGVGVGGKGGKGVGKLAKSGKAIGILAGLGIAIPGLTDISGHRSLTSDASTIGGGALTGLSVGGPFGAAAGALLGGAWDAGIHVAGWTSSGSGAGAKPPSAAELGRSAAWADAIQNDPKLAALMARSHATVNIATGAISVHESKNPQATAKLIRDEIEKWSTERQERG